MSAPGPKKRKLSDFTSSKGDKESKRIEEVVKELRKDFLIDGFVFEYCDDKPTGQIRCLGNCINKNASFSAKGARYDLNPDKVISHVKKYHKSSSSSSIGSGTYGKKSMSKADIRQIQEQSAFIIAEKHLSMGFFDSDSVQKRDADIIKANAGNPASSKELKLSRYKLKKLWKESQVEMRIFIKKMAPTFIERGMIFLEMDHKFMNNGMANFQRKLFGVLAVIKFGTKSAKYPLALEPSDSSASDEAIMITDSVLKEYLQESESEDSDDEAASEHDETTTLALKEYNLFESLSMMDMPIITDAACGPLARKFTSVSVFCMAHNVNNLTKGAFKKATEMFQLPENELNKVLKFIVFAREGLSKEDLKNKGICTENPQSLNDFVFDKVLTEAEKLQMYRLQKPFDKRPDSEVSEIAKKIDQLPLAKRLNLIRFTSIDLHLEVVLSWELMLTELSSFGHEYKYLLDNCDLPSFHFARAYKNITFELKMILKQCESNQATILESVLFFENILCYAVTENGKVGNLSSKEEAAFSNSLLKGLFTKGFMMLFQKISVDGKIIKGTEKNRISNCMKTALYLYWPRHHCNLHRLDAALSKSDDPFYRENQLLLRECTSTWQSDAVRFAKVLSNKLVKSEELDEDQSQELLSDDTDEIDPLIVGEEIDKIQLSSQGAKHSVEKDLNNYAKITRGEWRSEKSKRAQKLKREEETKKLFYGENAQKETSFPDSGMMLFFWKNRESEFPFLSKVAIYLSRIPCSSSEAEREFGAISHDTRDPSKNRQLARSIEMRRQYCAAPSFKALAEEAIRFEKIVLDQ